MKTKLFLFAFLFVFGGILNAQSLRNYKVSIQLQAPNGSFLAPYDVYVGVKRHAGQYGVFYFLSGGGNDNKEKLGSTPIIVISDYRDKNEIKSKLKEIAADHCKILSVVYYNNPSPYHRMHNERGHEIHVKRKVNYKGELYHQYKFRPINKSTGSYLNTEDWLVTYIGEKHDDGDKFKSYNYYKFSNNEWKFIFNEKVYVEFQKFNFLYSIQSYYYDKNIHVKDVTTVK